MINLAIAFGGRCVAEKRGIKRRLKRVTVIFGNEKPVYHGFTVDISDTGIFLKSNKVFPPSTIIHIELSIPDDGVAVFHGLVMWAKTVPPNLIHVVKKAAGMGIKITQFLSGEEEYHKLVEESHH